jgi:hypothetical protein
MYVWGKGDGMSWTSQDGPRSNDLASTCVALTFDPDEYLQYLDDEDWTDDQKREFIQILWEIIVGFVDLGFDLHPVQQALDSSMPELEVESPDMVASEDISRKPETRPAACHETSTVARTDSCSASA